MSSRIRNLLSLISSYIRQTFSYLKKSNVIQKIKSFLISIKSGVFRLGKQVIKEFRLVKIDPFNLLLAIVVPPLIIVMFALTSTASAANPVTTSCVVVSYDSNTFLSPNNYTESNMDNYTIPYVDAVNQSEMLELKNFYNATEEYYAMEISRTQLLNKEIEIIIVLPLDFSEMLNNSLPAFIECVPDASKIEDIQQRLNAVYDSIKLFTENNNLTPYFRLQGFQEFSIPPDYNLKFNDNVTFTLPIMIFAIAMVLTILVIVKEKPIPRLLLTPVQRFEILTSKIITYSLILVFQTALIQFSSMIMGMYLAGTILDLFLGLFMIGFTGMSLGLFISSISKTKTEANQLFFAFFIIIVILSGMFVSLEAMPPYLRAIASVLPLAHAAPLISGIVTKGKSFINFDFLSLLGLSVFLIIVSFFTFGRRRYEV